MHIDLKEFERKKTSNNHISILKHVDNHCEIVCKEVPLKKGIEEVSNYKRLNSAALNCVPHMIDYRINRETVQIYMTHIKGHSLTHFYKQSHMKNTLIKRFELILDNAIECIKSVHHTGLVHRDIKPDNLIIDDQCRVFLVDFGIAGDKNCITKLAGTSRYMSPEALFLPSEIDESSDFYSLGVSFIHVLGEDIIRISRDSLERITGMVEIQKNNRNFFEIL